MLPGLSSNLWSVSKSNRHQHIELRIIHFKSATIFNFSERSIKTLKEHQGCSYAKPIRIATNNLHSRILYRNITPQEYVKGYW
jgi:hypothetical protein